MTSIPPWTLDGDKIVGNDFTALTVDGDDNADVLKLIKSTAFTRPGVTTPITFPRYQEDSDTSVDGDQTIAAFETEGTYNGARGTCRFDGDADCTVAFGTDGKISDISNGWIFTPVPGVTIDVADDEYLRYGFWLKRTTKAGATTYNEVEAFAGAMGIPVSGYLMAVEGTAEYEGGAVGVYVKNVFDSEGRDRHGHLRPLRWRTRA